MASVTEARVWPEFGGRVTVADSLVCGRGSDFVLFAGFADWQ